MDQAPDDRVDAVPTAASRRFKPRRVMLGSLLVIMLAVVALARPMVRPYTLDLVDPICLNMIPMSSYSIRGASDMSWSYITMDQIPNDWVGQRIDGTLVSWNSGATFTADGVTLRYANTTKWGPCVGPAIN